MNIAVLFSGRIYGFEESILLYKEHIFKGNNIHIFIAHNSYNTEDLSILSNYENIHVKSELFNMPDNPPVKYSHENVDPNGYYFLSMWYHRNIAYKMMKEYTIKNNITFDCVISGRTDMIIYNSLELTMPLENTLYIPSHSHYNGLNDQFSYGTMKTMEIYCDLYNKISSDSQSNPETYLKSYINSTDLIVNMINIEYDLMRGRHRYNSQREKYTME
jgi:hypothetical protein